MPLLGGLFDREAIVGTFTVIIAIGEDLKAPRPVSLAEEYCPHSVRHTRHPDQIVQADLSIGNVGRRRVSPG